MEMIKFIRSVGFTFWVTTEREKRDTGSIERVNQTRNRWRRGESQADGGTRVRSAYLFNAQKAECSRGRSTYSHYIGLVRFYRGIAVLPYNTGGLSRREKHDMCTLYATTIHVSFTETRRQRERERERRRWRRSASSINEGTSRTKMRDRGGR